MGIAALNPSYVRRLASAVGRAPFGHFSIGFRPFSALPALWQLPNTEPDQMNTPISLMSSARGALVRPATLALALLAALAMPPAFAGNPKTCDLNNGNDPDVEVDGGSTANGLNALACGFGNEAGGTQSVAIGGLNEANGFNSIAIGFNNNENFLVGDAGSGSIAVGANNNALGVDSIALGTFNIAKASQSVAIGADNVATATDATAVGSNNDATGPESTALGSFNVADHVFSTAVGSGNFSTAHSRLRWG